MAVPTPHSSNDDSTGKHFVDETFELVFNSHAQLRDQLDALESILLGTRPYVAHGVIVIGVTRQR